MTLRVGIFVMTFPQASETFIVTKVLKLLDAGFDVQIFTVVESKHWDAFEVLAGREDVRARVHVVPPLAPVTAMLTRGTLEIARTAVAHPWAFAKFVAHSWRLRAASPQGFLKSLYTRFRFVGYDLDILHIEFDTQGVGIADLKEFLDCHVLYSARGTFQVLSLMDTNPGACEYLFRYVDGYHFISHFLENNTHSLGLPAEVPTWLIEPAIDLSLFRPASRSTDPARPLKVISVGRLSWAKGHEFALEAISHARAAGVDIDYTIYGSGPFLEPIRYAILQLGLSDCTRVVAVGREAMVRAYAEADVMLHAALEEGFCNAVIEAQAMELPVVTSDAGGLPENVDDGVTGFVVPRRDAKAMAAKLVELARDPALRRRLGVAGRARALKRFDLDRQAEAFVQLYVELAALPRRPVREGRA